MIFFILFASCFAQSFCYRKVEQNGKVVGYKKMEANGDGSCMSTYSTEKPKLDGESSCLTYGEKCPAEGDNFSEGLCFLLKTCIDSSESETKLSSQKYFVENYETKVEEYTSKDCTGTPTTKKYTCAECKQYGTDYIKAECAGKSGAFGTFVLLVLAFVFFLF